MSSYDRKGSFVAFSVTREMCTSVYLENKPKEMLQMNIHVPEKLWKPYAIYGS